MDVCQQVKEARATERPAESVLVAVLPTRLPSYFELGISGDRGVSVDADSVDGAGGCTGRLTSVPFAAHPGLASETAHVAGSRNVVQGGANQAAVSRVLLGARFKVEPSVFSGSEMLGRVPLREGLGHFFSTS